MTTSALSHHRTYGPRIRRFVKHQHHPSLHQWHLVSPECPKHPRHLSTYGPDSKECWSIRSSTVLRSALQQRLLIPLPTMASADFCTAFPQFLFSSISRDALTSTTQISSVQISLGKVFDTCRKAICSHSVRYYHTSLLQPTCGRRQVRKPHKSYGSVCVFCIDLCNPIKISVPYLPLYNRYIFLPMPAASTVIGWIKAFGMLCHLDSPQCLIYSSCSSVQVFAVLLTSDSQSLTAMAFERCAFGSFPILTPSKFLRTGHFIPSFICTPRRKVCFRFLHYIASGNIAAHHSLIYWNPA